MISSEEVQLSSDDESSDSSTVIRVLAGFNLIVPLVEEEAFGLTVECMRGLLRFPSPLCERLFIVSIMLTRTIACSAVAVSYSSSLAIYFVVRQVSDDDGGLASACQRVSLLVGLEKIVEDDVSRSDEDKRFLSLPILSRAITYTFL
jgi:hypothetical protein